MKQTEMLYEKYIKLGFKRIDIKDNVEFKNTGYYGFILSYDLNKTSKIEACSGQLDKPMIYIKKQKSESYRITTLTIEQIEQLINQNK